MRTDAPLPDSERGDRSELRHYASHASPGRGACARRVPPQGRQLREGRAKGMN